MLYLDLFGMFNVLKYDKHDFFKFQNIYLNLLLKIKAVLKWISKIPNGNQLKTNECSGILRKPRHQFNLLYYFDERIFHFFQSRIVAKFLISINDTSIL